MPYGNQRTFYSVLFYILVMTLVIVSKPPFIFNGNKIKPFGVGENKTIFSLGVFVVTTAIFSFYFFCIIDLVFGA